MVFSDREHMIGRNFVPQGSLRSDSFNFIFRACRDCNERKAAAERHLSTVTLFNSRARSEDREIDKLAEHKATRDYHPGKKGVRVRDATDNHEVIFKGSNFEMTFGLLSPPQPNRDDLVLLAYNHTQALFSLLTTENPRDGNKLRLLPADHFFCFGYYMHGDWGNLHLAEISQRTSDWPCYANITTADGYFRAILRRSSVDEDGWFWALEWNQCVRVVGGITNSGVGSKPFQKLPELDWRWLPDGSGRIRRDVPLPEGVDTLFAASLTEES